MAASRQPLTRVQEQTRLPDSPPGDGSPEHDMLAHRHPLHRPLNPIYPSEANPTAYTPSPSASPCDTDDHHDNHDDDEEQEDAADESVVPGSETTEPGHVAPPPVHAHQQHKYVTAPPTMVRETEDALSLLSSVKTPASILNPTADVAPIPAGDGFG